MTDLKTIKLDGKTYGVTPGSHAQDKNDPHGVTAEQVGARPNTWMPTPEQIGALPLSGGTMSGVLDLGGYYTKNAEHYNNVGIRTLSYNENPKGYIYLPGRSSILIGITFNSGYYALYSVFTNNGITISNVSRIIGDVDGLGFTIENENTLIITCNTPWSYGFVIYSGSEWASYF